MDWFRKLSWATQADVPDDQFVALLGPRWTNPSPGTFVLQAGKDKVTVTKSPPLEESSEPDSEMAIFKAENPGQDPATKHIGEVNIEYSNGMDTSFWGNPEDVSKEVDDYLAWSQYIDVVGLELEEKGLVMDTREDWFNGGSVLKENRDPLYTVNVWFERSGKDLRPDLPKGAVEVGVNIVIGSDAGNVGMALDEDRINAPKTMMNPTSSQILEEVARIEPVASAKMSERREWLRGTLVRIHESYYEAHAYKGGPRGKESDTARLRELQARASFQDNASALIPMLEQAIQAWLEHHEFSYLHEQRGLTQAAKYALAQLAAGRQSTNIDASMTAISLALNAMHVHGIVVERLGMDKKLLDELHAMDVSKIDEEASKIAKWVSGNCRLAAVAPYLYHETHKESLGDISQQGLLPMSHGQSFVGDDHELTSPDDYSEDELSRFPPEDLVPRTYVLQREPSSFMYGEVLLRFPASIAGRIMKDVDPYILNVVPPGMIEVRTPGGWMPLEKP